MVSAYFLAEPVRRDSSRAPLRKVYVKLLRFEIKLDVSQMSASIGACRRPTLGLDNIVLVFTHVRCADCAGSATSCCTLLDAAVAKRLPCALGLTVQCPRSAAAHRRDSQSAADSDLRVLSAATQEAARSSATPAGLCGARRLRLMRRWKPLTAPLPCGCFAHLCVGAV